MDKQVCCVSVWQHFSTNREQGINDLTQRHAKITHFYCLNLARIIIVLLPTKDDKLFQRTQFCTEKSPLIVDVDQENCLHLYFAKINELDDQVFCVTVGIPE